jgi:gamma-glutamylcyclotransferase (GGCT)/AIG2-like uncharacterized protein YtfP
MSAAGLPGVPSACPSSSPTALSSGTTSSGSTFGRLLQGQPDELAGYELGSVKIEDPQEMAATGLTHHDNVVFNGRDDSRISGTLFEITDAELAGSDRYEEPAGYRREEFVLASGKKAWVYRYVPEATGRS